MSRVGISRLLVPLFYFDTAQSISIRILASHNMSSAHNLDTAQSISIRISVSHNMSSAHNLDTAQSVYIRILASHNMSSAHNLDTAQSVYIRISVSHNMSPIYIRSNFYHEDSVGHDIGDYRRACGWLFSITWITS